MKEVIYVPTQGCMNPAASVNVILYDRLAKKLRAEDWSKKVIQTARHKTAINPVMAPPCAPRLLLPG